MRVLLTSVLFYIVTVTGAMAQNPEYQGDHGDWRVFTHGSAESRVCYTISRPTQSLPANVNHGEVFFLIASWRSGDSEEQPSFRAGYPLRSDSPPRAHVDSDRFKMFVSGQEGFLETPSEDNQLVQSMRRGSTMRVEATSTRGTATSYTFSLRGVTAALQHIKQICD